MYINIFLAAISIFCVLSLSAECFYTQLFSFMISLIVGSETPENGQVVRFQQVLIKYDLGKGNR